MSLLRPSTLAVEVQVFMNVATGGFGTEVTVKTDPKMKQQLGGAAYIITGMPETLLRVLMPVLVRLLSLLHMGRTSIQQAD